MSYTQYVHPEERKLILSRGYTEEEIADFERRKSEEYNNMMATDPRVDYDFEADPSKLRTLIRCAADSFPEKG